MRLPSGARGFESLRLRSAIEQLYKIVAAQTACIIFAGLKRSFSSADLSDPAGRKESNSFPCLTKTCILRYYRCSQEQAAQTKLERACGWIMKK